MSRRNVVSAVALLLTGAALLAGGAARQPVAATRDGHMNAERVRLRRHFDNMDAELRGRDVSKLATQQRDRRARLIHWLDQYSVAGAFPLNDGYAGVAVPIFRDADGTLCAMAYLIARSGRSDIVDHVARTRNTATIAQLLDEPALVSWLDEHGLTAAEAGRIQPMYGPIPDDPEADDVSTGYALASMALTGSALVTSYANLADASQLSALLGLAAGSSATLYGALQLDEDGGRRTIAIANTAAGVLAIGLALHGLHSIRGNDGGGVSERRVGGASLTVTPDLINVADRSRPGIVFHARF